MGGWCGQDKLLEDSTKTIGDSLTSLTSTLSKTLTITKKKKKAKAPRRKLFEDDEEEETEDNWHTKLPPRRSLTAKGPVVIKAAGQEPSQGTEGAGEDAVGEGSRKKKKAAASLSMLEKAVEDDEVEEEDTGDWLSARRKTAGASRRTDLSALARRRQGKSLFGEWEREAR